MRSTAFSCSGWAVSTMPTTCCRRRLSGLHQPAVQVPPIPWEVSLHHRPQAFADFVQRRGRPVGRRSLFSSPPSTTPTPEESVISMQQRTQIEHYLERLAPLRTAVVCGSSTNTPPREIAASLKLPLGTVKAQIHRAREQMCRPDSSKARKTDPLARKYDARRNLSTNISPA